MLDSILSLPAFIRSFWNVPIDQKIPVIVLFFVLYCLGYYSAKLLQNRTWWKWFLLLVFLVPFLIQIYLTKSIIAIGPVAIGFLRGWFQGSASFSPFGIFEGVADFYYSLKHRRGMAETEKMYQEAEEVLRRSQEYEAQARYRSDNREANSEAEKQRFREEMRRQRQEQSRGEEPEPQKSSSSERQQEPQELNPSILADAYEILGVPQGASLEECKKAYRLLMGLYHPDKVTQLSGSRRRQAEEETKRINASWQRIKGKQNDAVCCRCFVSAPLFVRLSVRGIYL